MTALTRGQFSKVTNTTLSTAVVELLAASSYMGGRNFLQIVNNSATNTIAFTLDGTDPVINGNGITLYPQGSATYDVCVPQAAVRAIGSAVSSSVQIYWM